MTIYYGLKYKECNIYQNQLTVDIKILNILLLTKISTFLHLKLQLKFKNNNQIPML